MLLETKTMKSIGHCIQVFTIACLRFVKVEPRLDMVSVDVLRHRYRQKNHCLHCGNLGAIFRHEFWS
jgi:hypothetical protein